MLLHKHYITILLQALLVLFAFASCIDDDFTGATSEPIFDENRPCYLTIKVASVDKSAQTRAEAYTGDENGANAGNGDFVHGDEDEHAIGKDGNFIVFFDKNKKLFTIANLEMANGHEDNPGHDPETDPEDYIEALYKTKIYRRKVVDKGYNIPASCLVVMNGGRIYKYLTSNTTPGTTSQEDILRWLWKEEQDKKTKPEEIGYDDDGHFMMTSDIVKIEPKHFGIDAEGNEIDNREDLDVHVERILAKFTFGTEKTVFQPSENADLVLFTGFDEDSAPQYIAKRWRIVVTGWGINALETESYLFKNVPEDGSSGWNDPDRFRSYWIEDYHYDNTYNAQGGKTSDSWQYPWQYRWCVDDNLDSYDEKVTKNGQGEITDNDNLLSNYSFNSLGLGRGTTNIGNEVVYTPENTYDAKTVAGKHDSRDELLAGTHLLVGAELQFEEELNSKRYAPANWFRDRYGIFYQSEQHCFVAMMHALKQTLLSHDAMGFTYYDWNSGGGAQEELAANTLGEYHLYYNEKELNETYLDNIMNMSEAEFAAEFGSFAPATLRKGDGKCLPWTDISKLKITDAAGKPLQICKKEKTQYGIITTGDVVRQEANENDIKSLLYEWLGAIDHFKDGKMYYAHGIYNINNNGVNDTRRWGVVRNNWYRFNLKDINSLGVPVDDPDQPIVPDRPGINDQINVSVYILDWHRVETTTPALSKQ